MEADFPAAHSMDTVWFGVDRDGHVGYFDTGSNGHLPCTVPDEPTLWQALRAVGPGGFVLHDDDIDSLIRQTDGPPVPSEVEDFLLRQLFFAAPDHALDNLSSQHGSHIVEPGSRSYQDLIDGSGPYQNNFSFYGLVMYFATAEVVREEIARGLAIPASGSTQGAFWFAEMSPSTYVRIHDAGLCRGCFQTGRDHGPERLGLFRYMYTEDASYGIIGLYQRGEPPLRLLHVGQLPPTFGRLVGIVPFTKISFAENTYVQPLEHVPCRGMKERWPHAYVASDTKTLRALPGQETAYRLSYAELTGQAELAFDPTWSKEDRKMHRQDYEDLRKRLENGDLCPEPPPDYPSAHSMDTTWFAVDRDGHVGFFETGERGHMPLAAFGFGCAEFVVQPAFRFGPEELAKHLFLATPGCAFVNHFGPDLLALDLKSRHAGTVREQTQFDQPVALYLRDVQAIQNELASGQARLAAAWDIQAVLIDNFSVSTYLRLHQAGVCLGCFLGYWWSLDHLGLFHYQDCDGPKRSYLQEKAPPRPLLLNCLPTDVQRSLAQVRYNSLCFAEATEILPLAHHPVNAFYWEHYYLDATDTVRPVPGYEDSYREHYLDTLRYAMMYGWKIEPLPDFRESSAGEGY